MAGTSAIILPARRNVSPANPPRPLRSLERMVGRTRRVESEQIYRDWVEARSFGCKACGFTSTIRRVVEQHLRVNHPELFEAATGNLAPPAPTPILASTPHPNATGTAA